MTFRSLLTEIALINSIIENLRERVNANNVRILNSHINMALRYYNRLNRAERESMEPFIPSEILHLLFETTRDGIPYHLILQPRRTISRELSERIVENMLPTSMREPAPQPTALDLRNARRIAQVENDRRVANMDINDIQGRARVIARPLNRRREIDVNIPQELSSNDSLVPDLLTLLDIPPTSTFRDAPVVPEFTGTTDIYRGPGVTRVSQFAISSADQTVPEMMDISAFQEVPVISTPTVPYGNDIVLTNHNTNINTLLNRLRCQVSNCPHQIQYVLNCGHCFCLSCIRDISSRELAIRVCPICRIPINAITRLNINSHHHNDNHNDNNHNDSNKYLKYKKKYLQLKKENKL